MFFSLYSPLFYSLQFIWFSNQSPVIFCIILSFSIFPFDILEREIKREHWEELGWHFQVRKQWMLQRKLWKYFLGSRRKTNIYWDNKMHLLQHATIFCRYILQHDFNFLVRVVMKLLKITFGFEILPSLLCFPKNFQSEVVTFYRIFSQTLLINRKWCDGKFICNFHTKFW